jgi:hypothetical protein
MDWRPILIVAGALAALLGLIAVVSYIAKRRRAAAVVVLPAAHEVALEALGRLRARHLLEEERYEEYWVELSLIVRTYVEGRFGLHAPEMTTEEFLAEMQRDRRLKAEHRGLLGEFLTESDLVKFARHASSVEDGERGYDAARRFVEESRQARDDVGQAAVGPPDGASADGEHGGSRATRPADAAADEGAS